jgi:hypothetical protein
MLPSFSKSFTAPEQLHASREVQKNGVEKKGTKNKDLTLGQALLFLAPRT